MNSNKSELRRLYREKRQTLSANEIETKSLAIAQAFLKILPNQPWRVLHIFLPIAAQKEVNTWAIIQGIWQQYTDLEIAVPVVRGNELVHHLLTPTTELLLNAWQIPEPAATAPMIEPKKIDCVLVPLLAYDLHGNRIGYGKGFYDRFLAQCRADVVKIGLSFFAPHPSPIACEPTDIRLHACITPEKWYDFK